MQLGAKMKDKLVNKCVNGLTPHLTPGEQILLLVKVNKLSPMLDVVAVTDRRLFAFQSDQVPQTAPKVAIEGRDLASARLDGKRFGGVAVVAVTKTGHQINLGALLAAEDGPGLMSVLDALRSGASPGTGAEDEVAPALNTTVSPAADHWWHDIAVVGGRPMGKALDTVIQHALPGEKPWLMVNADVGGLLAAFDDRLLLVKTGGLAGFMSGGFGGGRITTFAFSEITGIEYNSGMMNGVLEVLTPSYQGSANKDYWRGATKSRNADSNDPFTLSNCLPLPKRDYEKAVTHLNTLRTKVTAARQVGVQVVVPAQAAAPSGLADELSKLVALHQQGVLNEDEFAAAKQAAITRLAG